MPIIEEKIFKDAFLEILKDEPGTKRATGGANDPFSLATAKYYSSEIERANTALQTLKSTLPQRLKPALEKNKRKVLVATLAARLEYFAWEYHCALAPNNNNTLPNPTAADIHNLFNGVHQNTLANHAITTITTQFIQYFNKFLPDIDNDWSDLENIFFPKWNLMELRDIIATGSDTHKQGKSVVILIFFGKRKLPAGPISVGASIRNYLTVASTKLLKLVYKPSDLTLDYLLVGDTNKVSNAYTGPLPNIPGGSLFEIINSQILNNHLNPDAAFAGKPDPVLPVYPILPKNSGSILNAYGYLKFLKHRPKAESTGPATFKVKLVNKERPKWDWIALNNDELINYYRIFGWFCAIGLNFGIADAHNQNLIVHNRKPYLIDNEISFKWRCDAISKTGLHDVMGSPGPAKAGDRCHIYYKNGAGLEITTGNKAALYINGGINEAIDLFQRDTGNAFTNWIGSAALGSAIARYTPQATRDYGQTLRTVFYHSFCLGQVPNPPAVPFGANFFFRDAIKGWYNGNESEHRPNYVMRSSQHDWYDYLNCDYPAYYKILGDPQLNLYNASGITVQVSQPVHPVTGAPLPWNDPLINAAKNRTIAGTHYFDHYPSVYLFQIDLSILPLPAGTTAHLNNNVINDLSASFNANGNPLTGAAVESTEKDDEQWRIIDGNNVFHLRLKSGTTFVIVYKRGTAIEMIQAQYNLLKNDAGFRNQLINDAHAFITSKYPGVKPAPIYDSF
ncbi:MAG: DUF4135 domain-containing protein [Ignavibacteriaceae bacterium]